MNVTCDKELLLGSLNLVGRAVSTRSTKPILECVLITAYVNEGITLCGNDLEMSIATNVIPCEVAVAGSVALDAKLFTDIVRKMPGDFVTIETDEKNLTLVKSARAKLKIAGQPGDEFPVVSEEEMKKVSTRFRLGSVVLRDMIRQTIFSVSLDQSKIILTGELFDIKDGELRVVGLDLFHVSYRMAKLVSAHESADLMSAVIPAKALSELSRVLPSEDEQFVDFYFTDKRVVFETEGFIFVSRLLEGEFIKYEHAFNEDFSTLLVVGRAAMIGALERAMLLATAEKRKSPITLDIKDDELTLSVVEERGQFHEELPCHTDGKDLIICFNPQYMINVLRAIEEEEVMIKFVGQKSPCIIRGKRDNDTGTAMPDDHKYMIMPLRPPV